MNTGFGTVVERDLFKDEQTALGTSFAIDGNLHLQENPSVMVDFDFHYASADNFGSSQTFADPGFGQTIWMASLDGVGFLSTLNGETVDFALDSDAILYGEYVGFRKQFSSNPFGFDYFDLGCGFSHMRMEQEHLFHSHFTTSDLRGNYNEQLDSNYLGGEIRTKAIRQTQFGPVIVDFGFGFYWMNGDYDGVSELVTAGGVVFDRDIVNQQIDAFAVMAEMAVRTETVLFGYTVRPGLHFRYLSDIASIEHPHTEVFVETPPVSLSTQSGYTLGFNVEVPFCQVR